MHIYAHGVCAHVIVVCVVCVCGVCVGVCVWCVCVCVWGGGCARAWQDISALVEVI